MDLIIALYSNPNVLRDQDPGYTDEEIAKFTAAGICPAEKLRSYMIHMLMQLHEQSQDKILVFTMM